MVAKPRTPKAPKAPKVKTLRPPKPRAPKAAKAPKKPAPEFRLIRSRKRYENLTAAEKRGWRGIAAAMADGPRSETKWLGDAATMGKISGQYFANQRDEKMEAYRRARKRPAILEMTAQSLYASQRGAPLPAGFHTSYKEAVQAATAEELKAARKARAASGEKKPPARRKKAVKQITKDFEVTTREKHAAHRMYPELPRYLDAHLQTGAPAAEREAAYRAYLARLKDVLPDVRKRLAEYDAGKR